MQKVRTIVTTVREKFLMGEKKYFETGDFLQMATFMYYKGLK